MICTFIVVSIPKTTTKWSLRSSFASNWYMEWCMVILLQYASFCLQNFCVVRSTCRHTSRLTGSQNNDTMLSWLIGKKSYSLYFTNFENKVTFYVGTDFKLSQEVIHCNTVEKLNEKNIKSPKWDVSSELKLATPCINVFVIIK